MIDEGTRDADASDPWAALGSWRAGGERSGSVTVGERALRVAGAGPYRVGDLTIERTGETDSWSVGGEPAVAARDGTSIWVAWRGETHEIPLDPLDRVVDALAARDVTAPMPGVVLSVVARDGQHVSRGDLLAILEAMKMEMRVEAPGAGTVTKVLCAAGQQVSRGQRLMEFEPDAD